jgi:hypothetical protein
MTKPIATATYQDTWAGLIGASLVPQKTSRGGQRVTVYRWIDDRGQVCDGLRCGFSADRMMVHAKRHPKFSNIAAAGGTP